MNLGWKCAPPVFFEDAPTTPAGAAAPAAQPGPWDADLTAYFGDNVEAKTIADRYLREKVQPRITQLEQSVPEHEAAVNLYDALHENPEETLADVVQHFYGDDRPEVVERFSSLFTPAEAAAVAESVAEGDGVPDWAKPLIERDQAARDAEQVEAGNAAYQQTLASMRTAHPDLTDVDMGLIHPFMASTSDPDVAYAGYQEYKQQVQAAAAAAPTPAPDPVPPPVLGGQGGTASAPPVEKEYTNIDDALSDYFAERKAATAPPVL